MGAMSWVFGSRTGGGLALLMTVAMGIAGPGLAQSQSGPHKKPPPSASPEATAVLLESLVVAPDNAAQRKIKDAFDTIPRRDDEMAVAWLTTHADDLQTPFLLNLAGRLWHLDRKDEAQEWHALFLIRGRYNARRCADPKAEKVFAAMAGMGSLVFYPDFDKRRPAFGEAGLRVLNRPDTFTRGIGPAWICGEPPAEGKRVWIRKGAVPRGALKPESEWSAIRAEIVREMTVFFRDQGKPYDDPVPMAAKNYRVVEFATGQFLKIAWLDADRLVLGETVGEIGKPVNVLHLLHRDGQRREIARFSGIWCVGGGVVSYILRPGVPPGHPRPTTLFAGSPGNLTETAVDLEILSRYPVRQSPFDCRWVKSEPLSTAGKRSKWLPLRPGDGFLSFAGDDGKPLKYIRYHATEDATPVELPIGVRDVPPKAVRYFGFKDAYFLAPTAVPPKRGKPAPACIPVWWFDAKKAQAEEAAFLRRVNWAGRLLPFRWLRRMLIRLVSRYAKVRRGVMGNFQITSVNEEMIIVNRISTSSMMSLGHVRERPAVVDGKVVPRKSAYLCLPIDHRVLDGITPMKFAYEVIRLLQNPHLLAEDLPDGPKAL